MQGDLITLKHGRLKDWAATDLSNLQLLHEYLAIDKAQRPRKDTPRQKELLLQMIDQFQNVLHDDETDWSNDKKAAKDYILNY